MIEDNCPECCGKRFFDMPKGQVVEAPFSYHYDWLQGRGVCAGCFGDGTRSAYSARVLAGQFTPGQFPSRAKEQLPF